MAHEAHFFRRRKGLPEELVSAQREVEGYARAYGLSFPDIVYEMCDYDEINMIASYGGFPTRYPHWRWGMEFLQMQKSYEYGLQKIYEMVINTVPSFAYLLDNNTFMDQKLVMAHVCGHVDFFTHNSWFAPTNRKMLDEMANHATRIRRHMERQGVSEVERFIDLCLSIENLIDPYSELSPRSRASGSEPSTDEVEKLPAVAYMDRYINPPEALAAQRQRQQEAAERARRFPEQPERDVVAFVVDHGRLKPWQQDVLSMIREEAVYFAPQGQTKIMNEGWASYWHTTLMTRHLLKDSEVIDYADHHSGTTAMRPGSFNPYKIGLELWRDIEERWNRGQFGKEWLECEDVAVKRDWDTGARQGRQKLFEVRRSHNDITFVDTFLTEDFVRKLGLFTVEYDRKAGHYVVDKREFHAVKQKLLHMLATRGNPRLLVTDGNRSNRGELQLEHQHDGADIQLDQAEQTLGNLALLWGRPAHLSTQIEGKKVELHHDGSAFTAEGLQRGKKK